MSRISRSYQTKEVQESRALEEFAKDRMPITLKFADAIGEILTAGPIKDVPPLPFGHYI